jgi:adenosylmethionine---8-amino-7-oxononanoate aminotransferase
MTDVRFDPGAVRPACDSADRRRGQGAGAGEHPAMADWAEALAFDRAHLWHPYGSMTDPPPVWPVVAAVDVRLQLADGRELIDGMASWWAAIHGYNHPRLNRDGE